MTQQEIEKRKQVIIKNLNRGIYSKEDAELLLIEECKMNVKDALEFITQNVKVE